MSILDNRVVFAFAVYFAIVACWLVCASVGALLRVRRERKHEARYRPLYLVPRAKKRAS